MRPARYFYIIQLSNSRAFLSLTRQVLFLIPLILILPRFIGIDGILYSGPISDAMAIIATVIMAYFEFRNMKRLENDLKHD